MIRILGAIAGMDNTVGQPLMGQTEGGTTMLQPSAPSSSTDRPDVHPERSIHWTPARWAAAVIQKAPKY